MRKVEETPLFSFLEYYEESLLDGDSNFFNTSSLRLNRSIESRIKEAINEIPDFPKPGINFKDITPLFLNPVLSSDIVNVLAEKSTSLGLTAVVGIESRGFLFGFALAQKLELPFVLIRKKGKLPAETFCVEYWSMDLHHWRSIKEL